MTGTRIVVSVTLLYLVAMGAAVLTFLLVRSATLPATMLALCAAPAALYAIVAVRGDRDAKHFLAKTVASFGMLPILLLMAGASYDAPTPAPTAAPTLAPGLDEARAFAGALVVQDVTLAKAGITLMRSAAFADGSELRLTRFASVEGATQSLALHASTLQGKPLSLGPRAGLSLSPGAEGTLLVYVEQHGHELVEVRAGDAAQVLARLEAQAVPLPAPAPVASAPAARPPAERPVWPFAVGYSVVHALAFVGFIFWAGSRTTRVPAAHGVPRARPELLETRLASLAASSLPFALTHLGSLEGLAFDHLDGPDGRGHRIVLRIDEARSEVHVREQLGVSGAAPLDADEADMRPIGSVGIDPTRPNAQKVWAKTVQTSLLDRERLRSVPITLREGAVTLPPEYASSLDADGLLHVLCVVVTRSGYAWQPVFLSRR